MPKRKLLLGNSSSEAVLVAKYTFRTANDTLPNFNTGYTYETIDVVNDDDTTTREIWSNKLPTTINFNSKNSLLSVEYLDCSKATTGNSMFYYCTSLTNVKNIINTSNMVDMSAMFCNCGKLVSADVSSFDTKNVKSMKMMFSGCSLLQSLDLTNFDTKNVTDVNQMFYGCNKLLEILGIEDLNVENLENTLNMFYGCRSLTSLDLSNWNTIKLQKSKYMFEYCVSLTTLNVSNWRFDNIIEMSNMFSSCGSLKSIDLSTWSINNPVSLNGLFSNCNNLTNIVLPSNLNLSVIKATTKMFYGCSSLTSIDLSSFGTGIDESTTLITDMSNMFCGCRRLETASLSSWRTSKVTSMNNMFKDCNRLNFLDMTDMVTSSNLTVTGVLSGVPSSCTILVSGDFAKTESDCSWAGTFTRV